MRLKNLIWVMALICKWDSFAWSPTYQEFDTRTEVVSQSSTYKDVQGNEWSYQVDGSSVKCDGPIYDMSGRLLFAWPVFNVGWENWQFYYYELNQKKWSDNYGLYLNFYPTGQIEVYPWFIDSRSSLTLPLGCKFVSQKCISTSNWGAIFDSIRWNLGASYDSASFYDKCLMHPETKSMVVQMMAYKDSYLQKYLKNLLRFDTTAKSEYPCSATATDRIKTFYDENLSLGANVQIPIVERRDARLSILPDASSSIGKSTPIRIVVPHPDVEVHYTIDGSEPNLSSEFYDGPITLGLGDVVVKAIGYWKGSKCTQIAEVHFRIVEDPPIATVDFNSNGGTCEISSEQVEVGTEIGDLPIPKRAGYEFLGWWTDPNVGVEVSTRTLVSGNLTLYAHWRACQIDLLAHYKFEGNLFDSTAQGRDLTDVVAPVMYYGDPAHAEGCAVSFDGNGLSCANCPLSVTNAWSVSVWFLAHQTTRLCDEDVESIMGRFAGALYGDIQYLHFGGGCCIAIGTNGIVVFDHESGYMPSVLMYAADFGEKWHHLVLSIASEDEAYVLYVDGVWVRTGLKTGHSRIFNLEKEADYGFGGRGYYGRGFVGEVDNLRVYGGRALSDSEVVAIYELEQARRYAIQEFDPVGGVVSPAAVTQEVGIACGVLPVATRDGYSFDGWYTGVDGGVQLLPDTIITSNVTYYAHWLALVPEFSIAFETMGGCSTPMPLSKASGEVYGELPEVQRTGYDFAGWWTASDGGVRVSSTDVVRESITLYAHWQILHYKINYDLSGGINAGGNPSSYTVEDAVTLADPTREGYDFVGWSPEHGVVAKGSTGDKTFVANWKQRAQGDGLVAWYKFDGNADDSSGYANHGTIHGTTWAQDRHGNLNSACLFGGDDWISVPHSDSLSVDAVTVSVWVKLTSWHMNGGVGHAPIVCKSNTYNIEGSYRYQVELRAGSRISCADIDMGNYFALDCWQMLTITHGNGQRKVYLDGELVGESSSSNPTKLADELCIGRNIVGATEYYNGLMDDLRIYNRALTAIEVKTLYEGDGLVAWYKFDGNLNDESGNGYDMQGISDGYAVGHDSIGQTLSFSGGTSVSPENVIEVESSFTISCWLKSEENIAVVSERSSGIQTNGKMVLTPGHGATEGAGIGFAYGKNGVAIYEHGSSYLPVVLMYNAAIGTGWNFVTITVADNAAPKLYLNGKFVRQGVRGDRNYRCVKLGKDAASIGGEFYGNRFYGNVDDFRIYNRALSESEIEALCNGDFSWQPVDVTLPKEVSGSAEITIPASWVTEFLPRQYGEDSKMQFMKMYGSDYGAALLKKSGKVDCAGNELLVWQDYVAGTDPTDSNSLFRAFIDMVNGCPQIRWEPNLNATDNNRIYTVFGKYELSDEQWHSPTNDRSRFFKVSVEMP